MNSVNYSEIVHTIFCRNLKLLKYFGIIINYCTTIENHQSINCIRRTVQKLHNYFPDKPVSEILMRHWLRTANFSNITCIRHPY